MASPRPRSWEAIGFLVNAILPTATEAGVRLACHPHDPAYPPGGLNGVHHVLGSLDGLPSFLDLAPGNPFHGFNFCQGTIAEMSKDPNAVVLEAIREFGPQKKIFMVHFRNIMGGYLDFREAMPDEGTVDMAAAVRAATRSRLRRRALPRPRAAVGRRPRPRTLLRLLPRLHPRAPAGGVRSRPIGGTGQRRSGSRAGMRADEFRRARVASKIRVDRFAAVPAGPTAPILERPDP